MTQEMVVEGSGIVSAWGRRIDIPPHVWQEVVRESSTTVDLFGTALGGFTRPEMLALTQEKLGQGCRFRLLLQSPYCDAAHSMAMQKHEAIDDKILASRERLREFVDDLTPEERELLEVRSYPSWMSIAVFRGDGDLLVTHFLPWVIVDTSPTLRVHDVPGGVFGAYAAAIDGMWAHSDPLDLSVTVSLEPTGAVRV